jgi:general secretion pathway protein I
MTHVGDKSQAGFTLLETMVALAILAGAATSLISLVASSRRAQALAESDASTALHLRSLLARIGRDLPLKTGTHSGMAADGRTWSVRIDPFSSGAATSDAIAQGLFQIHIQVQREKSSLSVAEVSTLRRSPR